MVRNGIGRFSFSRLNQGLPKIQHFIQYRELQEEVLLRKERCLQTIFAPGGEAEILRAAGTEIAAKHPVFCRRRTGAQKKRNNGIDGKSGTAGMQRKTTKLIRNNIPPPCRKSSLSLHHDACILRYGISGMNDRRGF